MIRTAFLISLALAVGCEGPPPRARGVDSRNPGTATSTEAPAEPTPAPRRSSATRTTSTPIERVPPAPIVVRETVEERRARTRDLPAELGIAFGDPAGCFATLPREIRDVYVDVSCVVHEDGDTSSCRATPTFTSVAIEACLRSRSAGLRIEGGVQQAPRQVTARLELHR